MRGESVEKKLCDSKLHDLISVQEHLILKQFFLGTSVNFIDYLGAIVSYLVISIPIFTGLLNSMPLPSLVELVSQNAFVSMYLINSFTKVLDTSALISVLAGTTHRIMCFIEVMELNSQERKAFNRRSILSGTGKRVTSTTIDSENSNEKSIVHESASSSTQILLKDDDDDDQVFYDLRNVSVFSGSMTEKNFDTENVLIRDLTVKFLRGVNVLIWGKSGCGKTSLLRVLRGLWNHSSGQVFRFCHLRDSSIDPCCSSNLILPSHNQILFLPQKAITTRQDSLIQELFYPYIKESVSDADFALVKDYLKMFHLQHLLHYLPKELLTKESESKDDNNQRKISRRKEVTCGRHNAIPEKTSKRVMQQERLVSLEDDLPSQESKEKRWFSSCSEKKKEKVDSSGDGSVEDVLWVDKLSPGELQRIGFIRVLLSKASLVFLDEPTSSVSIEIERLFYEEMKRLGITFISCGHTDSLKEYHDCILCIHDDASVSVRDLSVSTNTASSSV
jgi:ABC-type uncharacterized transport system fused permease/ATPase subunit